MRSRSLAWIAAAALAAACGDAADPPPGPLGRVYMPTGLALHRPAGGEARLVVASSNADLRFAEDTGGAVLSIDPAGVATTRGVNIRSFAGELALVDPAVCGTSDEVPGLLAVTATRGSNTLNLVRVEEDRVACHRCDIPLAGPSFGDPFSVAAACGGGRRRAFVGHLRSVTGEAWISEYDLDARVVRSAAVGGGPIRSFAYDAARDRLYLMGLATGAPTPLRWLELGDCRIDGGAAQGCTVGSTSFPTLPPGLELRSMALAHPVAGQPQRAFLTARVYDPVAAALAGGRANDFHGLLVVVDLVDDALGGVSPEVVRAEEIGRGAQDVRVLPSRGAGVRDVVVALAVDDGSLWIYDDETGALQRIGRDEALGGASQLGGEPFGLAVDPEAATTARVYVGSFRQSFITAVDVPLATPDAAVVVSTAGAPLRITGGRP